LDGAYLSGACGGVSAISNGDISANPRIVATLADGYHYATVMGNVSGGTGNWYTGSSPIMYGTVG
jgi:hypothetical protein